MSVLCLCFYQEEKGIVVALSTELHVDPFAVLLVILNGCLQQCCS